MAINDSGHRPHGTHYGEIPDFKITNGPDSILVKLDTWGPQHNLFPTLYDMLQANWGDAPSRTVPTHHYRDGDDLTGWQQLTDAERAYIDKAFAGGTLPQALEMITFSFTIDGVTRAFTHQNVRTRVGAAFMQHGGRDNDWRHRNWTMPETIERACLETENSPAARAYVDSGKKHCITNWEPIMEMLTEQDNPDADPLTLRGAIEEHLMKGRLLYAALVDAGIPFQDARRMLPIGTQTYIHDIYNYQALKGVLGNRLEHVMDWEHNCVAQLMLRQLHIHCPPIITKYLGSNSDRAGKAAFAGLDSWPSDGKHSVDFPCACGHVRANHPDECCEVRGCPCAEYRPNPPQTFHRAEQNPFWVLTPAAMAGGPVEWVWTNGTYPHDRMAVEKNEGR